MRPLFKASFHLVPTYCAVVMSGDDPDPRSFLDVQREFMPDTKEEYFLEMASSMFETSVTRNSFAWVYPEFEGIVKSKTPTAGTMLIGLVVETKQGSKKHYVIMDVRDSTVYMCEVVNTHSISHKRVKDYLRPEGASDASADLYGISAHYTVCKCKHTVYVGKKSSDTRGTGGSKRSRDRDDCASEYHPRRHSAKPKQDKQVDPAKPKQDHQGGSKPKQDHQGGPKPKQPPPALPSDLVPDKPPPQKQRKDRPPPEDMSVVVAQAAVCSQEDMRNVRDFMSCLGPELARRWLPKETVDAIVDAVNKERKEKKDKAREESKRNAMAEHDPNEEVIPVVHHHVRPVKMPNPCMVKLSEVLRVSELVEWLLKKFNERVDDLDHAGTVASHHDEVEDSVLWYSGNRRRRRIQDHRAAVVEQFEDCISAVKDTTTVDSQMLTVLDPEDIRGIRLYMLKDSVARSMDETMFGDRASDYTTFVFCAGLPELPESTSPLIRECFVDARYDWAHFKGVQFDPPLSSDHLSYLLAQSQPDAARTFNAIFHDRAVDEDRRKVGDVATHYCYLIMIRRRMKEIRTQKLLDSDSISKVNDVVETLEKQFGKTGYTDLLQTVLTTLEMESVPPPRPIIFPMWYMCVYGMLCGTYTHGWKCPLSHCGNIVNSALLHYSAGNSMYVKYWAIRKSGMIMFQIPQCHLCKMPVNSDGEPLVPLF